MILFYFDTHAILIVWGGGGKCPLAPPPPPFYHWYICIQVGDHLYWITCMIYVNIYIHHFCGLHREVETLPEGATLRDWNALIKR